MIGVEFVIVRSDNVIELDDVLLLEIEGEIVLVLSIKYYCLVVVYDLCVSDMVVLVVVVINVFVVIDKVVYYFQQQGKKVLCIVDYFGLLVWCMVVMLINEVLDVV